MSVIAVSRRLLLWYFPVLWSDVDLNNASQPTNGRTTRDHTSAC